MKNIIFIFLCVISFKTAIAQPNLSETEKLAATAKVWGFLKYYHPNVAAGKFDWDQQLFDILPSVQKANNKAELSKIYSDWIETLGQIKPCKKCQENDELTHFEKNFDLTWLEDDKHFTKELTEKLKFIEQNRFQGKHYYVSTKGKLNLLEITNEKVYENFDWTNRPLRLLSLFRYWNTIEYFYPHKYALDTDWDLVLTQMLPKFSSTNSELNYHLAMLELVVDIDDSHGYFTTNVIQQHFGLKQIPASFKIIDEKLVINGIYDDSLAALNDIKIGDVITKVDGVDIAEKLKQNLKYINGANYSTKLVYAFGKILNGSTDSIEVKITRQGETKNLNLARYTYDKFNYNAKPEPWKKMEDDIAYINLGAINGKELIEVLDEIQNSRALILDLRRYPPNFYGYTLRNFLGARESIIAKQINSDLNYPGKYILTDQDEIRTMPSKFNGKVALLVCETTQSRAEYTALWIQNGYNVTTFGSQTAGAGGMMIQQEFVGGFKSYFTSSGIFYPDMSPVQRKGVKIDIEVKPTIQGIIDGKDEVLEKAIEFINSSE
ncbi:MAG: hypothetical protein CMO01_31905 [Thalassobius sp.]|nr:hypothetical protein [Thalassovita sp.]